MKKKKSFTISKVVTSYVGLWFLFILTLFFAANKKLTYNSVIGTPAFESPSFLANTFHWDSGYYLTIASQGYGEGLAASHYAFFPIYPLLIRGVEFVTQNYVSAAILVNFLAIVVSALLFVKIAQKILGEKLQYYPLIFLLTFPSAYFLVGVYGEASFLAFSLAAYAACLEKKWFWAGLAAALATASRLPGVFVALLVVYCYMQDKQWRLNIRTAMQCLAIGFLSFSGLLLYAYFITRELGSVFAIRDIYAEFWPKRELSFNFLSTWIDWARSLIWYLRQENYPSFFDALLPIGMWGIASLALLLGWKKLPKELVLFTLANLLLMASTTTYDSMNRYLLPVFPLYLLLAQIIGKHEYLRTAYVVVSSMIMAYLAAAFATNFWTG